MQRFRNILMRGSSRLQRRNFAYITPLEEFPIKVKVEPKPASSYSVKEATLPSGIRIIAKDLPNASVVSLTFKLACGSAYETESTKGAAHLLSTTTFVGTTKKSGLRIVRDLENIGAQFGATADRENISIELKVLADKLESAFELVAETISLPPKAPYVIKEAKHQAVVAYENFASNPEKQLDELVHEVAYGYSSPFGSSFYADNLDDLDIEAVLEYRKEHYKSGNLTISAVGVSAESLTVLAERYFSLLPPGKSTYPSISYEGGSIKVKKDFSGVSYAAVSFPGSKNSKSLPAIYNILAQQLHSSKGATTPFYTKYTGEGLVGFFAGGSIVSAAERLRHGIQLLRDIASGSLSPVGSLRKVSLDVALAKDSLTDTAESISVPTVEEVKSAASSILNSKPSVVLLGKTSGKSIDDLLFKTA